MDKESPPDYRVTWTGDALNLLVDLIQVTRKAIGNPDWVQHMYEECVFEGIRRLEVFPDLRMRYVVASFKCGAMTLRTLPLQVFFRQLSGDEIAIFECRWASLDRTGPANVRDK